MPKARLHLRCAILVPLLLLYPGLSHAEVVSNAGAWFMGFGEGSLDRLTPKLDRLRWWLDAQVRFQDNTDGFHQGIIRPGLGYALTDRATLWLGYAWVRTSPAGGRDTDEHRIWQQLTWATQLKPASILLRSRLEQRFLNTGNDVGWRFRQFVKLGRPFSFEPRLSLVGYDEVFFALNNTDWGASSGFAQNRLFVGFAWHFDAKGRVIGELGYLNQFINSPSGRDTMNHLVSVNLLFN